MDVPTPHLTSPISHHVSNNKYLLSLLLFVLALLSRLPDLDRFLTADEFLWVDRSRNFLAGLTNPAYQCTTVVEKWEFAQGLACTLRTGHPGVTTMWTGSFGFLLRWLGDGQPGTLHDYVVAVSTNPLDPTFIAPERLGTVLITSLWVVAVYWLVRRLFGPPLALVTALLIALDPFHIALSRVIHHDALSTTFMTLSVLCAFIYWGQAAGRKWLILSGLLAGFGFLSKSPALYLMPFIALVGLWFTIQRLNTASGQSRTKEASISARERSLHAPRSIMRLHLPAGFASALIRTILDGLLWFAVAIVVVFIFWPAMWVVPLETLDTVFFIGSKYATGGHAKGNYFLGHVSKDPGLLFYPITWLYRTSPLVLLGIISIPIVWLLNRKSSQPQPGYVDTGQASANDQSIDNPSSFTRFLPLILLFILGYYLLMTIGEKKQDRYFLPAYPWFSLIAAAGLYQLPIRFRFLTRVEPYPSPFMRHVLRFMQTSSFLILIILVVNGLLVATHFPYYFTYYNPLLGGIKGAARAITIGWGEGLNLAADYLNERVDPDHTRVASWYQSTFAPYYDGPAISYSKEKGKVLAGDYVIFYINQTQRRFPDDILFKYFETRFQPEKIITLHDLDYAWIYPSLGVDHYIQDQTYTGIASLLAWQWDKGDGPLIPGQPADFELYWEYLGKELDEPFFFRLVDTQGHRWGEGQSRPVASENPPPEQWRQGEIILERGSLTVPVGTPPGQYQLQIGFYTHAPAVTEGELLFIVPEDEALVTVGGASHPATYLLPATATPIEQSLGDSLSLLGATWPTAPLAPESSFSLDLYWRVEQPLPADFELHLGLMDEAGAPHQAWFNLSLAETFNPAETTWQPGDIIHTHWQLELLPEVSPGQYRFESVLPDDTTQVLAFGRLIVSE